MLQLLRKAITETAASRPFNGELQLPRNSKPSSGRTVLIQRSKISAISTDAFSGMSTVETVELYDNQIGMIGARAFAGPSPRRRQLLQCERRAPYGPRVPPPAVSSSAAGANRPAIRHIGLLSTITNPGFEQARCADVFGYAASLKVFFD
ncbi:unnamed protein product [Heligmosomoides polygyrus]|uniref:Uncharacterized protein n=1 Tax=Heligmosomoides polygyrus TaxID=6339 RepID=A0A3P7ZQT5_HELPZ|nr:unnamed protein product [Heligmosomoides polygyrus]